MTPPTLVAINPADTPDVLNQYSMSIGAPLVEGQDLLLRDRRLHAAGSHDVPVADAAVVRAAGRRPSRLRGQLSPDARATSASIIASRRRQSLMGRVNFDKFYDTNPNDAVAGTSAPSVARRYSRQSITGQVNLTSILGSQHRQRSARRLLEWRSRDAVGSRRAVDDLHARRLGAVHDRPVARLGSLRAAGAVFRHVVVESRASTPFASAPASFTTPRAAPATNRASRSSARSRSSTRRRRRSIS